MKAYTDKTQEEKKSQSAASVVAQKKSKSKSTFQLMDNRPERTIQKKLINTTDITPQRKVGNNQEKLIQRIGARSNTFRLVVNGVTRDQIDDAIDNIPGGNGGHAELNGNAGFNVVIYALHTLSVSTVRNSLINQLPNAIIGSITRSVE